MGEIINTLKIKIWRLFRSPRLESEAYHKASYRIFKDDGKWLLQHHYYPPGIKFRQWSNIGSPFATKEEALASFQKLIDDKNREREEIEMKYREIRESTMLFDDGGRRL